tara:strand:+ start:561 stop:689 length:129 start_codon:yes stop_codon:yes gene_type:complete
MELDEMLKCMLNVLFLKDAAYVGTSGSEHIIIPKKISKNQIF